MMKKEPRILCLIPALPSEIRMSTLQSIVNQTVPVTCTILLTKKINESMLFPEKISKILNEMLDDLKLENYDYLLRVDCDTVLPSNFLEENLKLNMDVLGWGCAQLIKVSTFIKVMKGKFHKDHDDGYILVKYRQLNLKSSEKDYAVKPNCIREPGIHHGTSWFFSQGILDYRYGWEPISVTYNAIFVFGIYAPFVIYGFFYALVHRIPRFDVAPIIMQHHFSKYTHPERFVKIAKLLKMLNKRRKNQNE